MRCVLLFVLLSCTALSAAGGAQLSGDQIATDKGVLVIHPIHHATFLMQWNGKTIYVDPVGGAQAFRRPAQARSRAGDPHPRRPLRSGDPGSRHARRDSAVLVAPKSVAEKIPETLRGKTKVKVLANGEKTEVAGIAVEAVPAYNTTAGKEKFHPKGRDNGYVLTMGGKRVYIAGDTEDIPEMRPRSRPPSGASW